MILGRRGRVAIVASALAMWVIIILLAGTLSFFVFYSVEGSQARGAHETTTSTTTTSTTTTVGVLSSTASTDTTSYSDTTQTTASTSSSTTSYTTPSTTSSTTSTTSSSTTSTRTSSSSQATSTTSSSTTFVLPVGGSEVLIPPGIQNADAQALNITFDPYRLTVQVGVNNTIYFVNSDLSDNLGHVIESTSWPTGGQVFAFPILPGKIVNVTLTTPGTYTYNCEWHPVWMTGTIVVLPASS